MHAEAPVRAAEPGRRKMRYPLRYLMRCTPTSFAGTLSHDERMERTADRDGIMVWSEIPNCSTSRLTSGGLRKRHRDAEGDDRRDRTRPR